MAALINMMVDGLAALTAANADRVLKRTSVATFCQLFKDAAEERRLGLADSTIAGR